MTDGNSFKGAPDYELRERLDHRGRGSGTFKPRRYKRARNKFQEPCVIFPISMLESPAYRVLSLTARRILDRICIELVRHGGRTGHGLTVTYEDFVNYGMDRDSIPPAVNELEALGFIIVKRGRGGNGEFKTPSQYIITGVLAWDRDPSYEWRAIETDEDAKRIAAAARQHTVASSKKNRMSVRETPTGTGRENPDSTSQENPDR